MKLKKTSKDGRIVIDICDNCFSRGIAGKIGGFDIPELELCNDCFFNQSKPEIIKKFGPIKRLKWYELLYQYEEEGYELWKI